MFFYAVGMGTRARIYCLGILYAGRRETSLGMRGVELSMKKGNELFSRKEQAHLTFSASIAETSLRSK